MGSDDIWPLLRMTRSALLGTTSERRGTYVAALEQAEQMFTAASSVGVATRPLLLFYGLSQGGRAVAAAAASLPDDDYRLKGHGITTNHGTLDGPITGVQVYPDNSERGSFRRLSQLLNSPLWGKVSPVTLGELWNSLPEGYDMSLDRGIGAPPLSCSVDSTLEDATPVQLTITGLPPQVMPSQPGAVSSPELDSFLGRYPALAGAESRQQVYLDPFSKRGVVQFRYPVVGATYQEIKAATAAHTQPYRLHDQYVFPIVGNNTAALHPLMSWWAVLYALSMLARYHPEAWAKHIAVDTSTTAVPIEQLLTKALAVVPEVMLKTLLDVTSAIR